MQKERSSAAAKNLLEDPVLKSFLVGKKICISESLTPQRKKLYGDVNKYPKKLMWNFIWSHDRRVYVKKNDTATTQHACDNADKFAKFKERTF